jgi:hydroxyacylglutathione hydrolase
MILYYHFASAALANTYVLGSDSGKEITIVDPLVMDVQLLRLIEDNGYYVRNILLTRPRPVFSGAIKTLLRIYDARLYGSTDSLSECPCIRVADGDRLELSGLSIDVVDVSGMAGGALFYRCGNFLFTGDLLGAGTILSIRQRTLQHRLAFLIRTRIEDFGERTIVLPGSGPPTSIGAERRFNPFLKEPQ